MVGEIRKMEIWRFVLNARGENMVEVPMGTKLMAVGMHESHVCMYGMVDALAPLGKCKVHVVGLKEELPKKALHLIGMVQEKEEVERMKEESRQGRDAVAEMGHDKEGKMIKFGPAQEDHGQDAHATRREDHGQDAHATFEELFVFLEVELVPQGKRIMMPEGPVRH